MKATLLNVVLGLACVILAVLFYVEHNRNSDLQKKMRDTQVKLITRPTMVNDEIEQYQKRIEELERTLAARPEPLPEEEEGATETTATSDPLSRMDELMENPAAVQMMRTQQRLQVEPLYQEMFQALELNEEEQNHLTDLLLNHQMAGVQQVFRVGQATPEERETLFAEIKEAKDAVEKEIETFMNNEEDFAYYKDYTEQIPTRQQLSILEGALTQADAPLAEDQRSQLLAAMHEERSNYPFSNDLGNSNNADLSNLNRESAETYLRELSEVHANTLERARQFLDEKQLQVFQENQALLREMEETGVRMSLDMFAPSGNQE